MKNNKAYTLFEVLILISIIGLLSAISLPIFIKKSHNPESNITYTVGESTIIYNVGDLVYIDGLDVTGKVVDTFRTHIDIIVKSTNGIPVIIRNLPANIFTKVIHPEK